MNSHTLIDDRNELPKIQDNALHQLAEMEDVVRELNKLMLQFESELAEQQLQDELEAVEEWAESYRRGLLAASRLSENGCQLLKNIQEKLKLAADELTRIEGESPNTNSTGKTARKSEVYLQLLRTIEAVMPKLEDAVSCSEANKEPELHA